MAIVDFPVGRAEFNNGATVMSATVPLDEADIDPVTGDPYPDARFQGNVTIVVTGPGRFDVSIWRGTDQTRDPWKTSKGLYPYGVAASDSPVSIRLGGPVKQWDAATWAVTARNR
jgi:hypothetical protein